MRKLNSWFEIDEKEYLMYILMGYEISIYETYIAWCLNDQCHREDGPAVIWVDDTKEWCLNGKRHREDGPAYIWSNGTQEWWLNDNLHREDGPAIIWPDGTQQWWIDGEQIAIQEAGYDQG